MRSKNATRILRNRDLSLAGLCNAVIEAGLLITVIITPLYFNPSTQHTFEPDKAALLRSIVLIALLAWLIKSPISNLQSPISNLQSPLVLPVLLLLAVYLIGTATSVLPRVSLWGAYERGQGLYTFVTYIILFFLAREILHTPIRRQRLIDTILLTSLLISVYAVLQHFGLDPVSFQTNGAAVTARAISTLGNPIFLGAYLVMVVPLTLLRLYQVWQPGAGGRAKFELTALYGALLITQLAAFFFAQSRGPTLGLVGGLGFGTLVWVARRQARRAMVVAATLGIVVLGLLLVLTPGAARLGRLGQLIDPASRTGQQRLLIWQGAVDLATAEPVRMWIGYGPETFRDMVSPHIPAQIAVLKPDRDFDRAHNVVFDLWTTTGLLGVAAYLLLISAVLYHGLRVLGLISGATERWRFMVSTLGGTFVGGLITWLGIGQQWIGVGLPLGLLGGVGIFVVSRGLSARRQPGPLSASELLAAALLAAIVGHVIETLVGMAIVATYTLFWIYAALIAGLTTNAEEQRSRGDKETGGQGDKGTRGQRTTIFSPPHPLTPSPPLPCTAWGLITGAALALLSVPLLTAGEAQVGLVLGMIVSVTLLFALLWLLSSHAAAKVTRAADGDEPALQYLGIAVGAILALLLLQWLPWPPSDITHATVATFVYILLVVLFLAVALVGADYVVGKLALGEREESKTLLETLIRQASWKHWVICGIWVVATVTAIWFSNINSVRADVFYKEGLSLSSAGHLQDAARALETGVTLNPREDRYHSGVGAAYAQIAGGVPPTTAGEPDSRDEWLSKADIYLRQARQLDPYRADHLRNLGLLYRIWAQLGPADKQEARYTTALDFYSRAAARNPVGVRIQTEWAALYAQMGRWEEAVKHYQASLRLNDGFASTHLGLGDAYVHLDRYTEAGQAYANALALDEKMVLQVKQQAIEQAPDNPKLHQGLALIYAQLGDMEAAQAEAQIAQTFIDEIDSTWDDFEAALLK